MNQIIERIEIQRKKMGLTQKELCKKCEIIDTTYSSWKNRNRIPSIEEATKIAKVLNISLEWLATGQKTEIAQPEDIIELLDYYHAANEEGKYDIRKYAKYAAKEHPSNLITSGEESG